MASVAVVEEVGASPRGQASFSIFKWIETSLYLARVEFLFEVMAIIGTPILFINSNSLTISSVSPELETAITESPSTIIPKSPCIASAGWTKIAGVPVEAIVAAIFLQISPDLPIPVITTLPFVSFKISIAFTKSSFNESIWLRTDFASISRTFFAISIISNLSPPDFKHTVKQRTELV